MTRRDRSSARVAALGEWFHNIDLDGVPTAPNHFLNDYPNVKWQRFQHAIPEDLTGKTVLDIGCNAGFYPRDEAARRRPGAGDRLRRPLSGPGAAGGRGEGRDIEFRKLSVYDVATLGERFDVVLFMGVLYHLRHPLLALDLIHDHVAGDLLVFQSMQRGSEETAPVRGDYDFFEDKHFDDPGYPKMHFIEHRYAGDPTNWWAPNAACSAAMLRSAGFEIVEQPESEVFVCRRVDKPADGAVYPAQPKLNGPKLNGKNGHTNGDAR
jgi:tRNA (mo5U34)-methyltransferase